MGISPLSCKIKSFGRMGFYSKWILAIFQDPILCLNIRACVK
jgi:hypothetical protein